MSVPGPDTPPRFYELARLLGDRGVDFVLIGGFAVFLHGYQRATKDVDVVPDPDPANLSRLWAALAEVDVRPADAADLAAAELPLPFTPQALIEGRGNWVLYTTLGRVDVMQYVEDSDGELTYAELREGAERVDLEEVGHPLWVASVEDLIAMKERAGRDVDRIDVTALRMAHGLEDD